MFNYRSVIIVCFVFLLFISISSTFAIDNETIDADEVVHTSQRADIYFNASALDDNGNGSKENPYKTLNTYRIVDNSNIHLADGEYFVDVNYSYTVGLTTYSGYKAVSSTAGYSFSLYKLSNVSFYGENVDKTIVRGFKNYLLDFNNDLSLNNLTFVDNNIVFEGGDLKLNNVVFKDSTARYWDDYNTKLGSAITITNPSNVEIYDSKFINLTSDYGGAIYMNYGNLKIINSTFDNTAATLLGGAIYANAINVNISKSRFSNAKSLNGGAIYVFESLLNVKDSNFTTCDAGFGCAIGTLNSTTSIDNSYFSNNLNEYASGAVFAMFGELNISNSRFSNNSNGNTYSVIVSDINANLFNNTFESDNSEVLAYFAF